MADRENVIRLIEEEINVCESVNQCYRTIDLPALRDILSLLKEQETANLYKCPNCGTFISAENVVRCMDCKHGRLYDFGRSVDCELNELATEPNFFCADWKRKQS